MKFSFLVIIFSFIIATTDAQPISDKINAKSKELANLEIQRAHINDELEYLKLLQVQQQLDEIGLPAVATGEELIRHSAYSLSFSPKYKQARWVAHIITPDVVNGVIFRTNDFRPDSLVKSGSAVEADYFTKTLKPDGTFAYNSYGYDRGHLAPSADFRWSKKALSESYYYSNMSPQLADFNRGGWGDLEDVLRGYVYRNTSSQLYVVTGPILEEGLPVIEKGLNKLPIPKKYFKVALDLINKRAIGFIMPNQLINNPLKSYALTIDQVEKETGLDFFSKLPVALQQTLESSSDTKEWLPELNQAEIEPLPQESLPKNFFNTTIAKQSLNRNEVINVCGTVVGARLSRAGNVLINLDKPFPNQVFTIFIKKEDIINFSYNPVEMLKGKVICVKGKVIDLGGTPSMYISTDSELKVQ